MEDKFLEGFNYEVEKYAASLGGKMVKAIPAVLGLTGAGAGLYAAHKAHQIAGESAARDISIAKALQRNYMIDATQQHALAQNRKRDAIVGQALRRNYQYDAAARRAIAEKLHDLGVPQN